MAFDKVKTLRAAERYLELGKIPAAVKEYCKIVEGGPDDFTTLNMLGDLYVRVGNQPAAVACFRRIAEHYRDQDFALKAIAMFKKIDRLQPNDAEISTHLADLYAEQDLVVEARAHYLTMERCRRSSIAGPAPPPCLRPQLLTLRVFPLWLFCRRHLDQAGQNTPPQKLPDPNR